MKPNIANLPAWLIIYTLGEDLLARIVMYSDTDFRLQIGSVGPMSRRTNLGTTINPIVYESTTFGGKEACVGHGVALLADIWKRGHEFMFGRTDPTWMMLEGAPRLSEGDVVSITTGLRQHPCSTMVRRDGQIQPESTL